MKNIFNLIKTKSIYSLILLFVMFSLISCQEGKKTYNNKSQDRLPKPTKLSDRFSYIVGYTMGMNFKRDSIYDANYDYLIQAILDVLDEKEPLLSTAEMDSVNNEMQEVLNVRTKARMFREKRIVEKAKEESFKFLEENKTKPGVKTLPIGLQYKVLKSGSGGSPKFGDYVKLKAKSAFLDGTPVSNPGDENKPIYIQLKEGLLLAWLNALPLMKKGDKWILYSPSDLAFGEKGTKEIPPFKLIVFELELLDFQVKPYPDMPDMPSPPLEPGNQPMPEAQPKQK
ncbi:MAG: FKBP-type peptidyl-prolyl cis-trans isomerase N-terminal domain-containing protein [bacterium]